MPRTPTLPELVKPFVRGKFDLARTAAIDIRYTGTHAIDADIRSVDASGFERFFYSGTEHVAWSDVREITVRALDGSFRRTFDVAALGMGVAA